MIFHTLVISPALRWALLGAHNSVTPETVVGKLRGGVAGYDGNIEAGALLSLLDRLVLWSREVGDQKACDEGQQLLVIDAIQQPGANGTVDMHRDEWTDISIATYPDQRLDVN